MFFVGDIFFLIKGFRGPDDDKPSFVEIVCHDGLYGIPFF